MPVDIYAFPTLYRVVEAFPKDSTYILDKFFAEGESWEKEEIEIQTKKGHKPIAPYVNPLLPGKVVLRTGFTAKQYAPALLKPMRDITHNDLKVRQAGESLYNPDPPDVRAQKLVAKDLIELNDTITRRKIQMASELIFKGKVTQIGEGVSQILDWDFSNKTTLSGTDLFSHPDADIIGMLGQWKMEVMRNSGVTVRLALTTYTVGRTIARHPVILKLTDNKGLDMGQLGQQILPDGVVYHGYLKDVDLHIYSYTGTYTDDEGAEQDFIPEGTLALLPDGKPFKFDYAANLIMGENGQFLYVKAQITPQSWTTREPAARFLQLLSRPIPIPENVDGWYIAIVL